MNRGHIERSTDASVRDNAAPVARGGDAKVIDAGGKWFALVALVIAILALIFAVMAKDEAQANMRLSEARYADLVARNDATSDKARIAERDARVAVERSHDLMARVGRLEAKAGIYSTDH